jgi:hypothetical protein
VGSLLDAAGRRNLVESGVFAYITDADAADWQSSIDTLCRPLPTRLKGFRILDLLHGKQRVQSRFRR